MENRERPSAVSNSCKKHPKHQQSPGVCSLCLRERLSTISTSSSHAVTNVSSSSVSSISSVSSTHCSSNAQSPMHKYGNPRKPNYDFDANSKGYLSLMEKSRSVAFVSEKMVESDGKKKKRDGFWSRLLMGSMRRNITHKKSKEGSSRLMHSRTMREMLNQWV